MAKRSAGRPKRPFTKEQIQRLLFNCIAAICNGEEETERVTITIPKDYKFPKGFPRVVMYDIKGDVKHCHIVARKIIDWLYKKKYTTISFEDIAWQRRSFNTTTMWLNKSFNSATELIGEKFLDIEQNGEYNDGNIGGESDAR